MEKIVKKEIKVGDQTLSLEVGRLAAQANAAVLAQYGETVVLATVVSAAPREDLDYFPLHVEYRERYYAGGRISSSRFVKRERRPSDSAVLTARLVDRSIRPLFPSDYNREVQVIITVLSFDGKNDPLLPSLIGTSAALAVSDIPWEGPVGGVVIGADPALKLVVNPTLEESESRVLELIVAGTADRVIMLEGAAKEMEEKEMLRAINLAQEEVKKIVDFISGLVKEAGAKKEEYQTSQPSKEVVQKVAQFAGADLKKLMVNLGTSPGEDKLALLREETLAEFEEEHGKKEIGKAFSQILKKMVREFTLTGKRLDGRGWEDIRELTMEVGVLPRTHGSAIFKRGGTQALSVVTLGAPSLEQWFEGMEGEARKSYIHHYNMPPFSLGETGRLGWPSRREVGHGALAEKALQAVVPTKEQFPYMIRVVSEIMSCNGSTSMASACGSTLALMDAGVPLRNPVAGIAIGLITQGDKEAILTDIVGLEDGFGDMDFKVAGSKKGITALQLDVKFAGLSPELIEKVLSRARAARIKILEAMAKTIATPRSLISPYAPKIELLRIDPEMIGEVIGPGGRVIREIIAKTEAGIDVEDDGTITVSGDTQEAVDKATRWIKGITHVVKPGEIFEGEVVRVESYGAFVQITPGKDGLVHVSEMSDQFVEDVSQVVKMGQKVKVKVLGIDDLGRIKLTMKLEKEPTPLRSGPPRPRNRRNSSRPRPRTRKRIR